MTSHTPAPWAQYDGEPLIIVDAKGSSIGEMVPGDPYISRDEALANARLVTGAPDMLAALQFISEHITAKETKMTAKEYSYDSGCEMLAEYFLGQPRSPDDVKELSQHIQDAVEDWFRDASGETGMGLGTGKERPLSLGCEAERDPEARFESASLHHTA